MSFQVNSTDLKHGTEITESVSTAEEEFKNSTDEKLRKLFTEDVEKLKNSTDEETDRKLNPEDEEEFKKNRTEQSKRKDKDDDDEEQCSDEHSAVSYKEKKTWWKRLIQRSADEHSGLLQTRRKVRSPRLSSVTVLAVSKRKKEDDFLFHNTKCGSRTSILPINPYLEDKDDDDEDKEISRTQSMDNLLLMQNPQHQKEEFKNSTDEETDTKLNPEDKEGLKNGTDEETDRKLNPEDEEKLKKSRAVQRPYEHSGLLQTRRKVRIPRLSSVTVLAVSKRKKEDDFLFPNPKYGSRPTINPHLEDKDDDDEDKEISRTQSMDNLALMQNPQHQSQ